MSSAEAGPGGDSEADDALTAADVPSSGCDGEHAGRLFCDGFESGDISAWDQIRDNTGGTVVPTRDTSYRGEYSLRATGPDTPALGPTLTKEIFASAQQGEQWVRAYYFFTPGTMPTESLVLSDSAFDYSLVWWRSVDQTDVHTHGWREEEFLERVSADFPAGRWVCVELHVSLDEVDGFIELYLDGESVVVQRNTNTVRSNGLTTLSVGMFWQQTPGSVAYVDEVVADLERIGCDE